MDPQLAEIYGTNQGAAPDDDLEKNAAAELLVKLAEEQGVDLNQFSDEEVQDMINDIYGGEDEGGEVKVAQADDGCLYYVDDENIIVAPVEEENLEKAAEVLGLELVQPEPEADAGQEKIAEADTLGRVMAHAMVQELNEIEKDAAGKLQAAKEGIVGAAKAVGRAGKAFGRSTKEGVTGFTTPVKSSRSGGSVSDSLTKWQRAKKLAPAAGLAAAGGGGTYAATREKKGEADIQKLAEARAWELANEAGYVDEQGNLMVPEQEKLAEADQVAVDTAALQMLEQAGIPVEWNG